jgi:hypothetical protein
VKESSPIVIHTAKEWHIRTVICMLIGSLKAKMDRPNYFLTSSCFLAHEADDGTYWDKQTTRYIMAPPQNIFFFFQITFSHRQKSKRIMKQSPVSVIAPCLPYSVFPRNCPDVLLLFLCRPYFLILLNNCVMLYII